MLTKMIMMLKKNSGEENSLAMRQTYTHRFQCRYLLHRYPFDTQAIIIFTIFIIVTIILIIIIMIITISTQECEVLMVMGILDLATVSLIPHELAMRQNVLSHFLNGFFSQHLCPYL